jgi:Zn-dependent protease
MATARDADRPTSSGWNFDFLGFWVSVPWNALIGILVIAVLWYPEFAGTFDTVGTWVLSAVFALLLMISVLVHEVAHALAARGFGYHVSGITLWAMGGFTTYRSSEKHGPGREAVIAAAGPVSTIAIAAVAAFLAESTASDGVFSQILWAIAVANALIGVFNLLPGSPLDGGAIVKSAVWAITGSEYRGQVIAAWIGRVLAVLLAITPFAIAFLTGTQPSLAAILIAIMLAVILWTGASGALKTADANQTLRALSAAELAKPVAPVQGSQPLRTILSMVEQGYLLVTLDPQNRPTGVVSNAAAVAVPEAERDRVTALELATRVNMIPSVPAGASAVDVLRVCQENRARFVSVTEAGKPSGLIDTDAVFVAEGP